MTIRKKLTLLYSALLAGFIIVFGVVIFGVIRSAWIETVDRTLWETTEQVINNSRAYPVRQFGSPVSILIDLPELDIFRASGVLVQVWTDLSSSTPRLVSASENLAGYRQPLDPHTLGTRASVYTNISIDGIEVRVLTRTVIASGQNLPLWNVQVAASLQTINAATEKLSIFMLIGGVMAVVSSFGMGMWLSNQTLRPIEQIIQAADSISTAKDLGNRLPWSGPMDELGRLASVFNRMMDRVEHLFGVQQRFVADVSHELRTPLTTIRGNLDLAEKYGMDAAMMEAIAGETDRMTRMVKDLLLLARADYGGMTLDRSEIDLDTILADVYQQALILAKDRVLRIQLAQLEPVRILGNTDRIKQLLLNLVSNAINFTPDGGQITLRLYRSGQQAHLQVEDTGIGIAPEHLGHIFDRFYQAEPSRAKNGSGGTGLGLSIARWIAEAHEGSIEVQSVVEQGTVFTVRLPALAPCQPDDDDDLPGSHHTGQPPSGLRFMRRRRPAAEQIT
ncbi:MAG: HAMP domain-containing histidine kinase [Chloroflexi bacterium]|nr:HAMP domain-containing histidine kinase [Chloroflexota bacterium]